MPINRALQAVNDMWAETSLEKKERVQNLEAAKARIEELLASDKKPAAKEDKKEDKKDDKKSSKK